jgi:2-dehydropantoate 2-reductase
MAEVLAHMKIGILGPGAIGSMLAALLDRSGYNVCCYGSEHAVESIRQDGIQVESGVFGSFNSRPTASVGASSKVDILFVAVKAPALEAALVSIPDSIGSDTAIVSLLNGIGHRELIRRVFGPKVVVGAIGAVEASLSEYRVVQHRSPMIPHIEIASDTDVGSEILSSIVAVLENAGLSATIRRNENEVIWRKLARLSAIATMTAYTQLSVGEIRTDKELRAQLQAIVDELCHIARAEGVDCSAAYVMQQIDGLPEALTTSLQRDIRAGRPSEIQSILGEPIRLGQSLGLSLPKLEHCYSHIRFQTGTSRN